jgi:hypothetical protein
LSSNFPGKHHANRHLSTIKACPRGKFASRFKEPLPKYKIRQGGQVGRGFQDLAAVATGRSGRLITQKSGGLDRGSGTPRQQNSLQKTKGPRLQMTGRAESSISATVLTMPVSLRQRLNKYQGVLLGPALNTPGSKAS